MTLSLLFTGFSAFVLALWLGGWRQYLAAVLIAAIIIGTGWTLLVAYGLNQ